MLGDGVRRPGQDLSVGKGCEEKASVALSVNTLPKKCQQGILFCLLLMGQRQIRCQVSGESLVGMVRGTGKCFSMHGFSGKSGLFNSFCGRCFYLTNKTKVLEIMMHVAS